MSSSIEADAHASIEADAHALSELKVKMNLVGMLISKQHGIPLGKLVAMYNAYSVYEPLPAGFEQNREEVIQMLKNHADILEVRVFHNTLYVYIRDPVPDGFLEFREIVFANPIKSNVVGGLVYNGPLKPHAELINMDNLNAFRWL
ncbi:unnamed protein product [Orchesella dallaii]|uniref:Uncharacterized protein n=1 Tax=Orchesella dallaii TaxID=48710 RepID=A0ABP1Q046_9HEXA